MDDVCHNNVILCHYKDVGRLFLIFLRAPPIEKSGGVTEGHDVGFLLYSGERLNPTFG